MLQRIQWWLRQKNSSRSLDYMIQDYRYAYIPEMAYKWMVDYATSRGLTVSDVILLRNVREAVKSYIDLKEYPVGDEVYFLPKIVIDWIENYAKSYMGEEVDIKYLMNTPQFRNAFNSYTKLVKIDLTNFELVP